MLEQMTWTAADGTVIAFDGASYAYLDGQAGRFHPGADLVIADRVQAAGGVVRSARHRARRFVLPIVVRGTSSADIRAKVRALVRAFDGVLGDGTLSVLTVAGDTRVIRARCVEGFEGVETWETRSTVRQQFVADMIAVDPFWTDPAPTVVTLTPGGTGSGGWFPFLPITLISSELVASTTIVNGGDVDRWPLITITGPLSDPTIRNVTTGQALTLDITLAAGETLTLDADPAARTVLDGLGVNRYTTLTSRQWWPLRKGANAIRVEGASSDPSTSVAIRYTPGYLSV